MTAPSPRWGEGLGEVLVISGWRFATDSAVRLFADESAGSDTGAVRGATFTTICTGFGSAAGVCGDRLVSDLGFPALGDDSLGDREDSVSLNR
jgi:hypothetical protein